MTVQKLQQRPDSVAEEDCEPKYCEFFPLRFQLDTQKFTFVQHPSQLGEENYEKNAQEQKFAARHITVNRFCFAGFFFFTKLIGITIVQFVPADSIENIAAQNGENGQNCKGKQDGDRSQD